MTSTHSREIACSRCGGRFRIEAKPDRSLPSEIACPRCSHVISLEDDSERGRAWVSRSHADIFRRTSSTTPLPDHSETSSSFETDDSTGRAESGPATETTTEAPTNTRASSPATEPTTEDATDRPDTSAGVDVAPEASGGSDHSVEEEARETSRISSPDETTLSARRRSGRRDTAEPPVEPREQEETSPYKGGSGGALSSPRVLLPSDDADPEPEESTAPVLDLEEDEFAEDLADATERAMASAVDQMDALSDDGESRRSSDDETSVAEEPDETMEASEIAERFDEIERVESSERVETVDGTSSDEDVPDDDASRRLERAEVDDAASSPEEPEEGQADESSGDDATSRERVGRPSSAQSSEASSASSDPARPEHSTAEIETDGDSEETPSDATDSDGREREEAGSFEVTESGEEVPPEADLGAETTSDSRGFGVGLWNLAAFLVALVAASSLMVVFFYPRRSGETPRSAETSGTADASARLESLGASVADAVQRDAEQVAEATPDVEAAVVRAGRAVDRAGSPRHLAEQMLARKRFEAARRMVLVGLMRGGESAESLRTIFSQSIERDESLRPELVELGDNLEVDALRILGGGRSIGFRVTRNGASLYSFKPAQTNWDWRVEVAAYVLCKVVACHFDVPRNRPARIRRSRFEALYTSPDGDPNDYRERFDRLEWTEAEGPNGETHAYLYGTLEDWVPNFVRWPIEYTDVWSPWLDPTADPAVLEQPLEEALADLGSRGSRPYRRRILGERGDATTRSLARQLSSLLTFDFLVLNWDRFSTVERFYGVNNQFADGRFVSIDNGAAFPPRDFHLPRVQRHLTRVGRFSRSTIASIRALEPAVIDPLLFPHPSSRERKRLDVFWQQRSRLLDHVEALLAQHGAETVYAFE